MKRVLSLLLIAVLLLSGIPAAVAAGEGSGTRQGQRATRAEMEAAVAETAFAYYFKGPRYQYDNTGLDVMGREWGGRTRVGHLVSPESATSDEYQYGVCTAYAFHVYYEALGYRLYGLDMEDEFLTDRIWRIMENQADAPYETVGSYNTLNRAIIPFESDPVTEDNVDTCILRWKKLSYELGEVDQYFGVDRSPHFANFGSYHLDFANGFYPTTEAEQAAADAAVHEFLHNWEVNLRPGDLLLVTGHMLVYVGNGNVLDCTAHYGGKYDRTNGVEYAERYGSVYRMNTLDYYFNTKGSYRGYWLDGTEGAKNFFAVMRPLNALVADDGDGDPGNDLALDESFAVPAKAVSRQQYPGIEIDRTVDVGPYGSAASGGKLTYSVKITNKSNDANYVKYRRVADPDYAAAAYTALPVTETVPAGTAFLSATGGGQLSGDRVEWLVDVAAGKTAEVTYTVRVTSPLGGVITADGGTVADIPSNVLSNTVGGAKLGPAQQAVLTGLADTAPAAWDLGNLADAAEMPERVYQKMGAELDLPTVPEMVAQLFTYPLLQRKSVAFCKPDNGTCRSYVLRDETEENARLRGMLVNGYWGGYRFFTGLDKRWTSINHFDLSYLEPGDILVYVTSLANATTGVPGGYEVMLYAGKDSDGDPVLLSVKSDLSRSVYDEGASESATGGGSGSDGGDGDDETGGSGSVVVSKVSTKLWNALKQGNVLFFLLRPSQVTQSVRICTGDHTARTPLTAAYLESLPLQTSETNGPHRVLPAGSYYLAEDIDFESTLRVAYGAVVTLCLNGHSLRGTLVGDSKTNRYLSDGFLNVEGTMDLCDHTGTGKLQVNPEDRIENTAYAAYALRTNGTFNFHSGSICDSHGRYGVLLISGTAPGGVMNMYGGSVSGNRNTGTLNTAAAIELQGRGILNLYGGSITGNGAENTVGGAIDLNNVNNGATSANLYGGTISGNLARNGGGVYVSHGTTLRIFGGTLSGNTAALRGDDVYLSGAMDMTGGVISDGGAAGRSGYSVITLPDSALTVGGTAEITGGVDLVTDVSAALAGAPRIGTAPIRVAEGASPIDAAGLASGAEIWVSAQTPPQIVAEVSESWQAGLFHDTAGGKITCSAAGEVTVEVPRMLGDLNGDEKVNGKDAVFLQRYVAGGYDIEVDLEVADLNGDGKVNGKDAVRLQRYVAGGYGITLT